MASDTGYEVVPDAARGSFVSRMLVSERRLVRFLAAEWSDPVTRGGLLMLANTGITGALGLVYWTLAARLYPQSVVGRASALVSMATLLATVGQFNVGGMLVRFLPQAGKRSRPLVLLTYGVACTTTLLLTVLVEVVINLASDPKSQLRLSLLDTIVFVACVMASVIFSLQDYVLIGIRRIGFLAIENGSFGLAKLIMLAILAGVGGWGAIFASWMLPLVATIPFIGWLVFGRLLPARGRITTPVSQATRQRIKRFVMGDAIAGIFAASWGYALPPIVAAELGSAANARFYAALLFAGVLDLVGANYAMPLVVEASHNPGSLSKLLWSTARRIYIVLVPPVLVFVFAGGYVLQIYGSSYASAGKTLGLLGLACLPRGLLTLYYAVCNVAQRTHRTAMIQGMYFVLVITGSALFAHQGINSVAIVIFVVSMACGAAVIPSLLRAGRGVSA